MIEEMTSTPRGDNRIPFDPFSFIDQIAAVSRVDARIPDPSVPLGRECYAFSKQEDAAFEKAAEIARDILKDFEEGKDYEITTDAIGNMFVTLFADTPAKKERASVMIGSHLDSVRNGGKYDGVAGVATGMGVLHSIAIQSEKPKQNFTLAIFRSEESSPQNGVGCLGSAIATGLITEERLNAILYDRSRNLTLKDHFVAAYGLERWNGVVAQIQNPVISSKSVSAYLESHIEQSVVVARNEKDVGVVTDGIGGAQRDVANLSLTPETVTVENGSHKKVVLTFTGKSGHTGGLPPNPAKHFVDGVVWYREDALAASSPAVNKLLGRYRSAKVIGSAPKELTGFTSVPANQAFELLVPATDIQDFEEDVRILQTETSDRYKVGLEYTVQDVASTAINVVPNNYARSLVILPQIVSEVSTEEFLKQGTETGTTRATIVDFVLSPGSLQFNLDLREVNEEHFENLVKALVRRTKNILPEGSLKTISAKVHAPISTELSEALQQKADSLGVSFVLLPSIPGHDADRVAAKGIPTGMVFFRQDDGVSHNPAEMLTESDFKRGFRVMKEVVFDMLYK